MAGLLNAKLRHERRIAARLHRWYPIILGIGALLAVTSGYVWNLLCKLKGWLYYVRGFGAHPILGHVFIWGALPSFTLAAITLATFWCLIPRDPEWEALPTGRTIVTKWLALALAFSLLSGLAALLFFALGVRTTIESGQWTSQGREIAIGLLWALTMSAIPLFGLLPLRRRLGPRLHLPTIAQGVALTVLLVFLALACIAIVYDITDDGIRGIVAAIALRTGLFATLYRAFAFDG